MKVSVLIIVNFLLISSGFSQEENSQEFIGALHTSNNDIISYKIKFNILEGRKLEGTSQTDFYGKNNTKSKITGTIDKKGKNISFSEISNISSSSEEDAQTFCFVRIDNLKIRKVKGKGIIQGKFNGFFPSGDTCATGTIYMASSELLAELNISEDSIRKLDSLVKLNKPSSEIKYLRDNDVLNVNWTSKKIILEVWDGSKEDNDVISIYFNDHLIEENLIIKNDKRKISIPFSVEKGTLKIVAINEGESATNTVNFLLKNGNELNSFTSILKEGEKVLVEFNR